MTTDALPLSAPLIEATVLEDRAQIVRRGRIALPAGVSRLAITGIAPVVADRTIVATVSGHGAARVADVRVQRERIATTVGPLSEREPLRATVIELEYENERLTRLADADSGELSQLNELRASTLAEIAGETAWGRIETDAWHAALRDLGAREAEVRARQLDWQERRNDVARDLTDLESRLDASLQRTVAWRTSIVLTIDAVQAGEFDLRLTYVVPGACWRPSHVARLDGGTVAWSAEANVWQDTGEDWDGIVLRLSTERPSLRTEPPRLESDVLSLRRKETAVAVEARQVAVQDTGGAAGRPADQLPGIDDGGEARAFTVAGATIIPSDGRPHRVPLHAFTTSADSALVITAELAPAAILRTTRANPTAQPLLAGPVDLLRGGGPAGRATVLYVAPGARFDLGWGADPQIAVQREAQLGEERSGIAGALSGWSAVRHRIAIHLSNLGDSPRRLLLRERVPVSEVEQVEIKVLADATDPAA